MQIRYAAMIILIISLPSLVLANTPRPNNTTTSNQNKTYETINQDGDLSLNPEQNKLYWNPHAVDLTNESNWRITYNNQTEMHLETSTNEKGHIATGAWWTTSFKTKQKIPLYTTQQTQITAEFQIKILNATCNTGNEWLRIALASATQRNDGTVVYTEIDLWDSPTTMANPTGNINQGGNIIYKGGDVIEYKIDQLTMNESKAYKLDLTSYTNTAWQLEPGDRLESVYFVIEAAGAVNVTVIADYLHILALS